MDVAHCRVGLCVFKIIGAALHVVAEWFAKPHVKEERLDHLSYHVAYWPAMGDLTVDDQLISCA